MMFFLFFFTAMPPGTVNPCCVCKLRHTILTKAIYLFFVILCFMSSTLSQTTPEKEGYAAKSFEEYSSPLFHYNTLAKLKCDDPDVIFDILVLQYLAPHYKDITSGALSVYALYFTRHMNTYFPGSRLALGTFSSQGSTLPCYDLIMPLTSDAEKVRQGFARLGQQLKTEGQKVQYFTPPHPHLGRLAAAAAALDSRLGWDNDPLCPPLQQSTSTLIKKKRARLIVLFANDYPFFIPVSAQTQQLPKLRTAQQSDAARCSATGPSYVTPSSTSPDRRIPINDDATLVSLLIKKGIWVTTFLTEPTFETIQDSLLYDQLKMSQLKLQQFGQPSKPISLPGTTSTTIPHPIAYIEDVTNAILWGICRPDPRNRAPLEEVDCHTETTPTKTNPDTPTNTDSSPENPTTNVDNGDPPSTTDVPTKDGPSDTNTDNNNNRNKTPETNNPTTTTDTKTRVPPSKEGSTATNSNDNPKENPDDNDPNTDTDTKTRVPPSKEGSTDTNSNDNPKENPDDNDPNTDIDTKTRVPPSKEGSTDTNNNENSKETPDGNNHTTETDAKTRVPPPKEGSSDTNNTNTHSSNPKEAPDQSTTDSTGDPNSTSDKETTGYTDRPPSTTNEKTTDPNYNTHNKPENTNSPNSDKDHTTSDTTPPTDPSNSTNGKDKDKNTPETSTNQDRTSSASTQPPKEKPSSAAHTLHPNPLGSSTMFVSTKPPVTSSSPKDDESGLQPAVSYALAISGVFCIFTVSVCGLAHWKARKEQPSYLLDSHPNGSDPSTPLGYADDWTRELTNFSYSYSGNDNESDPAKTDLESNRDDEASLTEEDYVSSVNASTPSLRYSSVPQVAPNHTTFAATGDSTDSAYVGRRVHLHAT